MSEIGVPVVAFLYRGRNLSISVLIAPCGKIFFDYRETRRDAFSKLKTEASLPKITLYCTASQNNDPLGPFEEKGTGTASNSVQ